MSFLSCTNCAGPQSHMVQLAESDDGAAWFLVPGFTAYAGSVPDVIIRGQKLYIYTPGAVKRYDFSGNTWDTSPVGVSIVDPSNNPVSFVDPSAFIDGNNLINLFFYNSTGLTGDPAQCQSPPCTRYFDSAVEVPGSDGTSFITQTGHRITFTVNGQFGPTDPDIFYDGTKYYQYVSQGTSTNVYESTSLHGTYVSNATLPNNGNLTNNAGIPCGIFDALSGNYLSYGHGNNNSLTEIKHAVHANFNSQPAFTTIITGSSVGLGSGVSVASPGICENTMLAGIGEAFPVPANCLVYPSPATGVLNVNVDINKFSVRIYNSIGELCLAFEDQKAMNITSLRAGLYFAIITAGDFTSTQKIIKE